MPVNLTTNHYRFGINELAESTHGWYAAEDANPTIGLIPLDTTFLLRFNEQETGGTAAGNTDSQFQYRLNGGTWTDITAASSVVRAVTTTVFANGADLTKRLSGTGTFEASGDGGTHDGLSGGPQNDIAASGCSETECAMQILSADVSPGDVIEFRLTSPDWTITNNVVPTITLELEVSGAGAIGTGEAFGSGKVNLRVLPSAIGSAGAFGSHTVQHGAAQQNITNVGAIASAEAFGSTKAAFRIRAWTEPKARLLDGSDDYISIADHADVRAQRPMTAMGWVRFTEAGSTDHRLFHKRPAASTGWRFSVDPTNGTINFQFYGQTTVGSNTIGSFYDSLFHHFAVTVDGSGNVAFYIDGASQGTAGPLSAPTDGDWALWIGAWNSGGVPPSDWFGMDCADFRIYNASLTQAQVQTAMGGGEPLAANLRMRLMLRGETSPEPDISNRNHYGTLTGTAQTDGPPALSRLTSQEVVGAAKANLRVLPAGLASAEAIGAAKTNLRVSVTGIASAEAVGAAKANLRVLATGLASAEAIGAVKANLRVLAASIGSGEAIGSHSIGSVLPSQTLKVFKPGMRVYRQGEG